MCWAYCAVPATCLPHDCPASKWQAADTGNYVSQPAVTISVLTQQEADEYLAEAARILKGSQNVHITGATGTNAGKVNGMYKPTEEMCGNVTMYVKVRNDDRWLEYKTTTKSWQVKSTTHKGTDSCRAYCSVPAKCLPQECPKSMWRVQDGGKLNLQPTITISVINQKK